ncbi:MAG: hypothetical protein AUH96_13130 [Nitrospirae bacterium 13_2_20CM_2_61_4]|nr:MAG: hypothetical protein AUH96_13130 [Nitrospirae bacterium 13_2_20CM_2_61_4]
MGEFDEGKEKFFQLVKSIDPSVEVVIPVTPSRGMFLISLTKAGQRKFLTVSEEDILDLLEDADILKKVTGEVQSTLGGM